MTPHCAPPNECPPCRAGRLAAKQPAGRAQTIGEYLREPILIHEGWIYATAAALAALAVILISMAFAVDARADGLAGDLAASRDAELACEASIDELAIRAIELRRAINAHMQPRKVVPIPRAYR